jgi:hypothetical protein
MGILAIEDASSAPPKIWSWHILSHICFPNLKADLYLLMHAYVFVVPNVWEADSNYTFSRMRILFCDYVLVHLA